MNNKVSPAVSSKQLETNVVRVTRWDFAPIQRDRLVHS